MTNFFCKLENRNIKPTKFGGVIYPYDYVTERGRDNNNGSPIAQRIILDQKFDEQCRRNLEIQDNYNKFQYKKGH